MALGAVAVGGAAAGAKASAHVSDTVLLGAFALLMLLVGVLMTARQLRTLQEAAPAEPSSRVTLDDPIITISPTFR